MTGWLNWSVFSDMTTFYRDISLSIFNNISNYFSEQRAQPDRLLQYMYNTNSDQNGHTASGVAAGSFLENPSSTEVGG